MSSNGPGGLRPERARAIAAECYPEVLAYCRRHAPAGHEAADLAQETFLRFVRSGSYRERGKPIAYLMRIARSVCADASRERRLETVALDFDAADEVIARCSDGVVGESAHIDDWAEGPDIGDTLSEALDKLPSELYEAVELRYGSGLGVGEVARVLGISRFAVRRRIDAALKKLRNELKEGD